MTMQEMTSQQFTRSVAVCPLCRSQDLSQIAPATPDNTRIVSCGSCGLFISTPTLPFERLQIFYCEEFEGDAGSAAGRKAGKRNVDLSKQMDKARQRELPIVLEHVRQLQGKTILDLRSRNGALAKLMQDAGANVFASDPMLPNVELCRQIGLKAMQIGVFEHSDLSSFEAESFDAITGLTIHVLAHLPEPDAFLHKAFQLLKPGGYLILDEKDVFRPANNIKAGIFASGIGHFYHFTQETLSALIAACGFQLVNVAPHPTRRTAFRHLVAVARKPIDGTPLSPPQVQHEPTQRNKNYHIAQRSARLRAPFNAFKRNLRKLVKRARGH